ncbi:ERBB receptor feedback inhibitor 1 [Ambystoma mexicanum]|uniref:ERBB receptor feedback inhibitor 1 n=1 Tax=Ambystoma mexicanum TaxID=8296 RepID=UPI0037E903A5
MSTAGIAPQEIPVSLKSGFLHSGEGLVSPKGSWPSASDFEDAYFDMDPLSMAFELRSPAPQQIASFGRISTPFMNGHCCTENCTKSQTNKPSPLSLQFLPNYEEDQVVPSFKKLSMNTGSSAEVTPPHTPVKSMPPQFQSIVSQERSCRPLPPLPIAEDQSIDDADSEVEFLTSTDTDYLLEDCRPLAFKYGMPSRRSFRGCGQTNYAYFGSVAGTKKAGNANLNQDEVAQTVKPQKPEQTNRRLRRSHSGPAGSYNKPAIRLSSHLNRASPNSDEDKPEVPPRIPIPPRHVKPDYRRWSAEVTSNTYSDDDRPPKVPPREPLSRSNSRTPSPKSLPLYLNGVMPPTQSFAPDPKYVSVKGLQRQHSEGSNNKTPCILPIIENGKKASSTHYYLLPERPPYLHRYEKYVTEAQEVSSDTKAQSWSNDCSSQAAKLDSKAKMDTVNHVKCKHLSYVVSP